MKSILLICSLFVFKLLAAQSADIILYNGRIFTANNKVPFVQAIAIRGERVIAIGNTNDIMRGRAGHTELIDLKGKAVIPGINDAHSQAGPEYPGYNLVLTNEPNGPTPWEAIKDSIIEITSNLQPGVMIQASVNPDLIGDSRANRAGLDSISPRNPVMLSVWTGHGVICNSRALELLGYNNASACLGGSFEKDSKGNLTGVLTEYAGFKTQRILADKLPVEKVIADMKEFSDEELSLGITSDQVVASQLSAAVCARLFQNDFHVRHRVIAFPYTSDTAFVTAEWKGGFHKLSPKNEVSGIMAILDGTPIDRLSCLRTPYSDSAGQYGRLNFDTTTIRKYINFCMHEEQQMLFHVTGDSTLATLVRVLRSLKPDSYWNNKRIRIENGDAIALNDDDLNTIDSMGFVIVQNPTRLYFRELVKARFGKRSPYIDALKTYRDHHIMLAIGSDGPMNPFVNIMFASVDPANRDEALTVEQAVTAYTYGSAYAEHTENDKGTLVPGKLADLAVLSQDIFRVPAKNLPSTRSLMTIVNGKVVYKAADFK